MFEENVQFNTPERSAVLWRYMDFTRFVSLLDRAALHFSAPDHLGDPFEGSFSEVNHLLHPLVHGDEGTPKVLARMQETFKALRSRVAINCWHQAEHESAAMWKLYSRENDGIAVRTTCGNLADSFRCEEDIHIGEVSYVDYHTTPIPEGALSPFLCKRQEFSYEQEVRAASLWLDARSHESPGRSFTERGVYYSVDLAVLIKEVRVAPYAPSWFFDLVQAVVDRYSLEVEVLSSAMAKEPTPFIDEQISLLAKESTDKAPVPRIKRKGGWVNLADLLDMGSE